MCRCMCGSYIDLKLRPAKPGAFEAHVPCSSVLQLPFFGRAKQPLETGQLHSFLPDKYLHRCRNVYIYINTYCSCLY